MTVWLSYWGVAVFFFCFGWASCALFTFTSQSSRSEEKRRLKMLSEMDNKDEGNGPLLSDYPPRNSIMGHATLVQLQTQEENRRKNETK